MDPVSTTEDAIRIRLNGRDRDVPVGLTVKELIEWLDLLPALVVVEHNREILGRDRYDGTEVRDGDVVELVHFVGGG